MARQPANEINKTKNFDFLFGKYQNENFSIPYFQTAMTFKEAANWLKLVNEMPNASTMDWKIEELFQRDIDWKRVDNSIVPYLKTDGPKFFNSITVALMPTVNGQIVEYGASNVQWNPPSLDGPADQFDAGIKNFGPITCGYYGSGYENCDDSKAKVGQLCWNTEQVYGVAIDGQHRLAAIKRYVELSSGSNTDSRVPVILILLDPQLGFTMPDGLIGTFRKLFIDLNKNANIVKRTRQILLDDRDPRAMCVRSLIGTKLNIGLNELRLTTPPTLPLTLIDWHSDQAKFDDGPYITTILGLDWAIGKGFGIKSIDDPTKHDGIRELLNRLKSKLAIDLTPTIQRVEDCEHLDRPFTLNDDEMVQISSAFKESFNASFCHLLTEFEPYKTVISLRQENGTICPEFSNWYPLKIAYEKNNGSKEWQLLEQNETNLRNIGISLITWENCLNSIIEYKKNNIAFTVVFQKALILAFIKFQKIDLDNSLVDYGRGQDGGVMIDNGDALEDFSHAQILINGLNKILEDKEEFLSRHFKFASNRDFWLCSILNPTGIIDFTETASARASDILLLIGVLHYFKYQAGAQSSFDTLYNNIENSDNNAVYSKAKALFIKMIKNENHIADLILKVSNSDANLEMDEAEMYRKRKNEILDRAKWIWENL